jgi:hypothetical protein
VTTLRAILAIIAALFGALFAVPIIVIAFPFWAVALLVRCCRLVVPPAESWEGIIEFNEHVGWKPKPNLDAYCSFAAGTFRVKTDPEGWPGAENLSQSHVLALGDSFAFGFGVDNENAFFSLADSGLRVKAIGAPGYNMVQELLLLEKFAPQLDGKLVVWFVFLGNDIYDNLLPNLYEYRMPFVRQANNTGSWEVVTSHVGTAKWPFNPENNLRIKEKWEATFTEKLLGRRAYAACEFLIERGKETCARAGAKLVVMTVPLMNQLSESEWKKLLGRFEHFEIFDRDLPDRKISRMCERLGVSFVSGKRGRRT